MSLFILQNVKNAASNFEQVQEATPHKGPTVRPPASHHENYRKTKQTCRTLLEKQGLAHKWCSPMDPSYSRTKAGRPTRTYIQQLCEDTGCCPEDLSEAMNERAEWQERVRGIRASGTTWWWWWWWCTFDGVQFFFFWLHEAQFESLKPVLVIFQQ